MGIQLKRWKYTSSFFPSPDTKGCRSCVIHHIFPVFVQPRTQGAQLQKTALDGRRPTQKGSMVLHSPLRGKVPLVLSLPHKKNLGFRGTERGQCPCPPDVTPQSNFFPKLKLNTYKGRWVLKGANACSPKPFAGASVILGSGLHSPLRDGGKHRAKCKYTTFKSDQHHQQKSSACPRFFFF